MNCPFCAAPVKPNQPGYPREPEDGISWFTCGTMIQDVQPTRSDQTNLCVEGEVARLKARIERLEEAGDDLRVCCESVVSASDVAKCVKRWTAVKESKP